MKKFLSLFVALAMVFSLFAGVGAKSAKAAGALTFLPAASGNLAGGADAVAGITTPGVGTVVSLSPVTVNVTTAAVGAYVTAAVADAFYALTGTNVNAVALMTAGSYIGATLTNVTNIAVGDRLTFAGGFVGTVTNVTGFVVQLLCITPFAIAPGATVAFSDPALTATTSDAGWLTTGTKSISLTISAGHLHVGDVRPHKTHVWGPAVLDPSSLQWV